MEPPISVFTSDCSDVLNFLFIYLFFLFYFIYILLDMADVVDGTYASYSSCVWGERLCNTKSSQGFYTSIILGVDFLVATLLQIGALLVKTYKIRKLKVPLFS